MEVQLSPDQKALARHAIETGRIHHEEEVVQEALALWESRERTRSEVLAMVDAAEASLARGEGRVITEQSMSELADQVKQRGRTRFMAEQTGRSRWPTASLPKRRPSWTVSGIT
jgi:Arc/MetJ-type ribon-helix-helix transcriptional regulator